jgi:hypothetical protein
MRDALRRFLGGASRPRPGAISAGFRRAKIRPDPPPAFVRHSTPIA